MSKVLPVLALAVTATFAVAQDPAPAAGGGNNNRGDRGDRGRGNFEEFRQRMNERLKASLKVSDEEWGIIQPLVEKVNEKQRDAMSSRFGGRGPGGPGGTPPTGGTATTTGGSTNGGSTSGRTERSGSAEREALRTTLENENASADEVKAKLAAVRSAHQKSIAELTAARDELKKVLTVRQEAVLVSMGVLE